MARRNLVPRSLQGRHGALDISPGVVSGGFVYVTGMTGSGPDGSMPDVPEDQLRAAFAKIAEVLAEAGLDLGAVVEMTSYHIDMATHFDCFDRVRLSLMRAPHPAWTAVEVAALRRPGALVEIRVVASLTD